MLYTRYEIGYGHKRMAEDTEELLKSHEDGKVTRGQLRSQKSGLSPRKMARSQDDG